MRIDQMLAAGDGPVFSFEFFPPKTEAGEANLYAALAELRPLEPVVRVGHLRGRRLHARAKTIEIVKRIREQYGLEAMAHFTCVGATVPELRATLDEMRGRASTTCSRCAATRRRDRAGGRKTEGGLEYSRELVELIRADYPFAIGAACFPETHIHAVSPEADLEHL